MGRDVLSSEVKWLQDVIPQGMDELGILGRIRITHTPSSSLCLICKGGRMLCGKSYCPIIAKARSMVRPMLQTISSHIEGTTPPGVFVGRIGYPKVYIGPMVPPYRGDTEILDTPELWGNKGIQDIIDYRFSLIRGKARANVYDARDGGRLLDSLREIAMGKHPVDAEAVLTKPPHNTITLSGEVQPFGPSAPLKSFTASDVSVDRRIEDAFYDKDLKAADAVLELYHDEVLVTRIQRAFSLGMFGRTKHRKLVPTRWSITAVDSIISQALINQIKDQDTIDEYRVYSFSRLDNLFVAILFPERWSFEWIEAWFPGTTWNPNTKRDKAEMMSDWEPYQGRTNYPDIGGCYYACRLAVAEHLNQERRQASALVIREIHPGYILPLGVWFTRQSVREMFRVKPQKFGSLQEALDHAMKRLTIPFRKWVETSELLKRELFQRKLRDFIT